MPPSPPSPPSVQITWGCQFVGFICNAFLQGIALLLVGQYFGSHAQKDVMFVKFSVGLLAFLTTAEAAFVGHELFVALIDNIGDPAALNNVVITGPIALLFLYLVSFTAQIFLVTRVWIITKRNIFYTAPIVVLALLQIGAGLAQTCIVFGIKQFSKLQGTVKITSTQSGATAACDIIITLVLCWVLHDSRSGLKKTDSVIDRLIVYSINRGAATSVAALLNLILFVAKPGTFLFMIPMLISSPLYLISVVSMLTSREALRKALRGPNTFNTYPMVRSNDKNGETTLHVDVQKSVVTWNDGNDTDTLHSGAQTSKV